jgi:hypothetical protein
MIAQNNWRPMLAAAMAASFVVLAGLAHAVEFDQKLKAPAMRDAAELRSHAQSISGRLLQYQSADPQELINDAALVRDQYDLGWKLQRAIDEHRPLNDAGDVGLVVQPDGSVEIDINAHPQWLRYDQRLTTLLPGWDMQIVGPELIARGFRSSDVDILSNYVKTHDVRTMAAQRILPIGLGFNKLVLRNDRLRRPIDDGMVLSYVYQQGRETAEASRQWTAGLFAALDAQRRRILLNYISELKTTGTWTATDPSAVADTLATVRRADFAAGAASQAQGVTK